jgi:hypothetical protein
MSRPALGPTQPPVQRVPGILSPGLKRGRGVTLTTHPHVVPRSRMSRSYTSSPPIAFVACSETALAFSFFLINTGLPYPASEVSCNRTTLKYCSTCEYQRSTEIAGRTGDLLTRESCPPENICALHNSSCDRSHVAPEHSDICYRSYVSLSRLITFDAGKIPGC